MKLVCINWRLVQITLLALLVIFPFTATAQKAATNTPPVTPAPNTPPATVAAKPVGSELPKIWYSLSSQKDFRVEVTKDLFRADWVNIPPAAAKQGAYIHTECRQAGTKWVGTSRVYQPVAISKDSAVKETKMCHLTVRFEVDSITPQKITFHSEAMRNFDSAKCQLLQTAWVEFTWVPKK